MDNFSTRLGQFPESYVIELIHTIESGRYRPTPGTVGDRLVVDHPAGNLYIGQRAVAKFARDVYKTSGMWWLMVLEAHPDMLSLDEAHTVAYSWRSWMASYWPPMMRAK